MWRADCQWAEELVITFFTARGINKVLPNCPLTLYP